MQTTITEELLARYLAGNCTTAEKQLIAEWYASFDNESPYFENDNCAEAKALKGKAKAVIKMAIAGQVHADEQAPVTTQKVSRIFTYTRIAAAIFILLTAGILWQMANRHPAKKAIVPNKPTTVDIMPGSSKAILTLADGSSVVLDNAANGQLVQQGNVQVVKSKDGELRYQQAINNQQSAPPGGIMYNLLRTPRGGLYMIVLPDGSKVWLNAASSIKYPTVFTGNERSVEITGEVYFEVAAALSAGGGKKPFIVHILPSVERGRGGQVEVLGTHFNVNAYDDEESIKTTLLEGKVRIANRPSVLNGVQGSATLKPGEQAQLDNNGKIQVINNADIESVMAWKNGLFRFDDVTIQTVMRQIARWYDVDVVYERDVSQDRFRGKIYRDADISQVLKILELSGAHFKISDKKVIVQ